MGGRGVGSAGKGSVTPSNSKTTACRHDSPLHAASTSSSGCGAAEGEVGHGLSRPRACRRRLSRDLLSCRRFRDDPPHSSVAVCSRRVLLRVPRVLRVPSTESPRTRAASRLRAARGPLSQPTATSTKSAKIQTERGREYLCCCRIHHPRAPAHASGGSGVAQNG